MAKTALITGASTGIGREMARLHAQRGGDMVIVARNRMKLENLQSELQSEHSVKVHVIVKDLSTSESALEIYEEVHKLGIQIDYLINNAGFGGHGKFHEREWENDLSMIKLNIIGLTALSRFFIVDFVQRNQGKILNVSSTASLMPGPLQAVYFATKAYVTSFSNAIAEELKNTDVTITALLPGATDSEFGKISGMDKTRLFNRTFPPEIVAKRGYEGMLKGKLNVFAGVSFMQRIMFSLLPFFPRSFVLKTIREMQEIR